MFKILLIAIPCLFIFAFFQIKKFFDKDEKPQQSSVVQSTKNITPPPPQNPSSPAQHLQYLIDGYFTIDGVTHIIISGRKYTHGSILPPPFSAQMVELIVDNHLYLIIKTGEKISSLPVDIKLPHHDIVSLDTTPFHSFLTSNSHQTSSNDPPDLKTPE